MRVLFKAIAHPTPGFSCTYFTTPPCWAVVTMDGTRTLYPAVLGKTSTFIERGCRRSEQGLRPGLVPADTIRPRRKSPGAFPGPASLHQQLKIYRTASKKVHFFQYINSPFVIHDSWGIHTTIRFYLINLSYKEDGGKLNNHTFWFTSDCDYGFSI